MLQDEWYKNAFKLGFLDAILSRPQTIIVELHFVVVHVASAIFWDVEFIIQNTKMRIACEYCLGFVKRILRSIH